MKIPLLFLSLLACANAFTSSFVGSTSSSIARGGTSFSSFARHHQAQQLSMAMERTYIMVRTVQS
jgi:hypothetical protein